MTVSTSGLLTSLYLDATLHVGLFGGSEEKVEEAIKLINLKISKYMIQQRAAVGYRSTL